MATRQGTNCHSVMKCNSRGLWITQIRAAPSGWGAGLLVLWAIFALSRASLAQHQPWSHPELLKPLLETLQQRGVSASFEFTGQCSTFSLGEFPEFPEMRSPNAKPDSTTSDVIRSIFVGDPDIQVTIDPGGQVRIVQGGTNSDILEVNLGQVLFGPLHGEGPKPVMGANTTLDFNILAAKDLKEYMEHNKIKWPFSGTHAISFVKPSEPYQDKMIPSPNGKTLRESLDSLLAVFQGVWIYENCPKTKEKDRYVFLHFYSLSGSGDFEKVQ